MGRGKGIMALDAYFPRDIQRILHAIVIARGDALTPDGLTVLAATAAAFGLTLADVLPREAGAVLLVIDAGGASARISGPAGERTPGRP